MFTFCIRNNIYYGLNETNKTYNITHVEGCFANQLFLKFISHPSPALFLRLLANWLLVSFGQ